MTYKSKEQRVNGDGTPHVCEFDADGRCQMHPFTREVLSSNPDNESDYQRMARLILNKGKQPPAGTAFSWDYEKGAYTIRRCHDKKFIWSFVEQDYAINLCNTLNELPDETSEKPHLTGQCDSCHRGWTVIGETGADVIVKAFHCPCGHTTVME